MSESSCDWRVDADLMAISAEHIQLGKPLPWPVFDARGTLLLNQGQVIGSPQQLERLLERGLYYSRKARSLASAAVDEPVRRIDPFAEYDELLRHLASALQRLLERQADSERRILGLARTVERICESDADACLALIHLRAQEPSACEQSLSYALLCNLLARQLGLTEVARLTLSAAALTANVALLRFQDKLNGLRSSLNAEQRGIINKHPQLSAQAVAGAAIDNPQWLQIIEQHHEREAGQGYPQGLAGGQICQEAQLLSLAERYVAMITKRGYRERYHPGEALRLLAEDCRADSRERAHLETLQALLTPYPPGSFVRLGNQEIAVVTRRCADAETPRVRAVANAKGNPYLGSFARDTRHDDLRPCAHVEPRELRTLSLPSLWGYGQ
ncbi:HD domain-containing protein [Pseudomonas sp. UL073]|uniref:HD domain-containing protein n=1 Tax=Zestomonas insulae TaxID=2809017 RepID=A0ABS2IDH8_9GAMM|nr:HD domain-containing phosphohydrolase [Pseudomonas insulae]MBM7061156.1 HD domain-containing protein [Pseudomonas insulae]